MLTSGAAASSDSSGDVCIDDVMTVALAVSIDQCFQQLLVRALLLIHQLLCAGHFLAISRFITLVQLQLPSDWCFSVSVCVAAACTADPYGAALRWQVAAV